MISFAQKGDLVVNFPEHHSIFFQQMCFVTFFFAPLVTLQRERNETEAAGAPSEDVVVERLDGPSLLSNITGATDGNGRQLSPTVGNMPTTTLHYNCKYISPVCVRVRECSTPCARFMTFDSQVAWGILTRNRSSMLRFCRIVIECIVPCHTVSYITLLEYSCTAVHPADRTSRNTTTLVIISQGSLRRVLLSAPAERQGSRLYKTPCDMGQVQIVNPGTAAQHFLIDSICE